MEGACVVICFVSKHFAKTLDLKRELDVTAWRQNQRTPSNNDYHTPMLNSAQNISAHIISAHNISARTAHKNTFYVFKNNLKSHVLSQVGLQRISNS